MNARRESGDRVGRETADLRRALAVALKEHDRATAVRTAVEAVSSGAIDVPALYREVLVPLLHDTGEAWRAGTTKVWEEHLASQAVRGIVELVYPAVLKLKAAAPSTGRSVLLACPPEEAHDLGLRLSRPVRAGRLEDLLPGSRHAAGGDRRRGARAWRGRGQSSSPRTSIGSSSASLSTAFGRSCRTSSVYVGGAGFAHDREGFEPDDFVDPEDLPEST